MSQHLAPGRVILARDVLTREARFAGFAIVNSFLRQQQILADYLEMPPATAAIYLTIVLASTHRYIRRPTLGEVYRGPAPLPRSEVGSISRRAVAAATGLPRETVRRTIADLIADGAVIEVGHSRVTSRVGELVSECSQQALEALAVQSRQLFEELTRLGVLASQ